jgi:hypothetical protein
LLKHGDQSTVFCDAWQQTAKVRGLEKSSILIQASGWLGKSCIARMHR